MANIVSKLLEIALAEDGYLEKNSISQLNEKTANAGDGNYTKYWRDIYPGLQGNAWCQCFVNWCFVQAFGIAEAKKLLYQVNGFSFYTPTAAQYFKNNKQWFSSNPQKGDIVYYKNSQRIHHVGIVYKVDDNYIYTIEGNTSTGNSVIPNGGGVHKKQYSINRSEIAGYGRPLYDPEIIIYPTVDITTYGNGLKVTSDINIRDNPGTSNTNIIGSYSAGTYINPTLRTRQINNIYWFKTNKGYVSGKYLQGWVKDTNSLWWYNDCGKYPISEWKKIDNIYYYFMNDGYMAASSWIKSKDKELWYWVDSSGAWDESKTTNIKPRTIVI